jgi:hypothetical protein
MQKKRIVELMWDAPVSVQSEEDFAAHKPPITMQNPYPVALYDDGTRDRITDLSKLSELLGGDDE